MKNLNLRTLLAVLMLSSTYFVSAQDDDLPAQPSEQKVKEIKAQKSAYITGKLGLSPEQAQSFWPVYNQFDAEREKLRSTLRESMKEAKRQGTAMSEAQASELLEKGLASRQRELDLEKTYNEKFKKAIGAVKTLELHKAERDFNKELLRRYREGQERREGNDGRGPTRRP